MRRAGGKVHPVAGFEVDFALSDGESHFAFEYPNALVIFMSMLGIAGARNVIPAEALIAFLMQVGLRPRFRRGSHRSGG